MRLKGRVRIWDSGLRFETDKESTVCKECNIKKPANNVDVQSENCMSG